MNDIKKQRISDKLNDYVQLMGGQNKAANSLKNVSAAMVSQMLNNNWEKISNEMWRNVAAQIGYSDNEWNAVETSDYKLMKRLLTEAQANSLVMAITGNAGSGKSFATRHYMETNNRAFLLCCNEYWNRKLFLQELLAAMGRDYSGSTVGEMMHECVISLKKMDRPIVILDEADKLSDQVLYFFITLYNQLEDHCGIILCATSHLEKRISRGCKLNKKGYNEIYSRIGRKFIKLKGTTARDISSICEANGVLDKEEISDIIQDSESDLRRVKRRIHAVKMAREN